MGLAPASLVLVLCVLLSALLVEALDANQVGNLAAGIDIRIPLDAFVCDPWLIYYKISPTDYGRSLGVNYTNVQLLLTTPDNARTPVITFNLPQGEGVVSWRVNMNWNSVFYVAPHGAIEQGDVVQVKKGGGGEACLNGATHTTNYEFATYNGPAFKSLTEHTYAITTRFPNSRMTSPEAGLQTLFVPQGILVTPTRAAASPTSNTPKPSSTPSQPRPTSNPPTNTSKSPATSSQPHGITSSQSGSTTPETITPAPTDSSSQSTPTPASQSGADSDGDPSQSSAGNAGQAPHSDPQARGSGKSYTAAIAASAVIGTLLIILSILCCFIIRRRRQRERGQRLLQPYTDNSLMTQATIGSTAPIIFEPQARSAKGPPTRRYEFPEESLPPTDTSPSRVTSPEIPMDLERALAVVAAHVRSAEAVMADPSGSPPEYSRTVASTPFARTPATRVHGAGSSGLKRVQDSVTDTTDSSDWSR